MSRHRRHHRPQQLFPLLLRRGDLRLELVAEPSQLIHLSDDALLVEAADSPSYHPRRSESILASVRPAVG
jgi:hypothetical protein